MKFLSSFIIVLFIYSCQSPSPSIELQKECSIVFQPFNGIDSLFTKSILDYFTATTTNSIFVLPDADLPEASYVEEKRRYSADSIISFLRKRSREGGRTVVGLTTADIETSLKGKKHWGIMGLGYCPGSAAVISTWRLKKGNASAAVLVCRTINVCLHEVGHNFSLPHCRNKTCVMVAANGGLPSDSVGRFCNNCLQTLHQKGWKYRQPPTTYSQHTENKEKKTG
jgi:archaemetzincin